MLLVGTRIFKLVDQASICSCARVMADESVDTLTNRSGSWIDPMTTSLCFIFLYKPKKCSIVRPI
jgi:hypothetical protein